ICRQEALSDRRPGPATFARRRAAEVERVPIEAAVERWIRGKEVGSAVGPCGDDLDAVFEPLGFPGWRICRAETAEESIYPLHERFESAPQRRKPCGIGR